MSDVSKLEGEECVSGAEPPLSRRKALLGFGALAAGAVAGAAVAGEKAAAPGRLKKIMADHWAVYNARDVKRLMEFYAEDMVLRAPEGPLFWPGRQVGKKELTRSYEGDVVTFPKVAVELTREVEEGNVIVQEGVWRAFDTQPMKDEKGNVVLPGIPETNLPFLLLFEFRGDLITLMHWQYDFLHWLGADYAMSGETIETWVNAVRKKAGLPLIFGVKAA